MNDAIAVLGGASFLLLFASLVGFIWEVPYCGKLAMTSGLMMLFLLWLECAQ